MLPVTASAMHLPVPYYLPETPSETVPRRTKRVVSRWSVTRATQILGGRVEKLSPETTLIREIGLMGDRNGTCGTTLNRISPRIVSQQSPLPDDFSFLKTSFDPERLFVHGIPKVQSGELFVAVSHADQCKWNKICGLAKRLGRAHARAIRGGHNQVAQDLRHLATNLRMKADTFRSRILGEAVYYSFPEERDMANR